MDLGPNYTMRNSEGGPKLGLDKVLGPLPPGSLGFLATQASQPMWPPHRRALPHLCSEP